MSAVSGDAQVADMFFLHQRGRAMGVYTVLLSISTHVTILLHYAADDMT